MVVTHVTGHGRMSRYSDIVSNTSRLLNKTRSRALATRSPMLYLLKGKSVVPFPQSDFSTNWLYLLHSIIFVLQYLNM